MADTETAAEVLAEVSNLNTETTIPEQREFVIKRPGNINYSDGKSNYPGSKLLYFREGDVPAHDQVNAFFKENANVICTLITPDGDGGLYVMYTNFLEGEELEEFNEYSRSIAEHMREWRSNRAERAAKTEEREAEAKKEMNRLLEVAKKCEANHAAVIADNAKLKSEVKKLKRGK